MTSQNHRKTALVTGSGRPRIGNLIARDLAARGYRVVIHYHRSADYAAQTVGEIQSSGGEATAYSADLADEDSVLAMFDLVRADWQRLDVLVNTASVWSAQPLEEIRARDVCQNFCVNTLATFLCCQRAGLMMVDQDSGGAIINFGDAAMERPSRDYAAYMISKGSLPTLTRCMAVELAERNPRVRVNCVLPGSVMSPPEATDADQQRRRQATLVQLADQPETVCHTVRFLIENEFMNGTCITLDGGRTLVGP